MVEYFIYVVDDAHDNEFKVLIKDILLAFLAFFASFNAFDFFPEHYSLSYLKCIQVP